ncbi:MAG: endonuclease domain-containing protein [Pseudonocardia sp.]
MTDPPPVALGLDDLPPHRREALLWCHALRLDYDGIDDLVRPAHEQPCNLQLDWPSAADLGQVPKATRGDDGRYHLTSAGIALCNNDGGRPAQEPVGGHRHERYCHAWTDGTRYQLQIPRRLAGQPYDPDQNITAHVAWTVHLIASDVRDPAEVPPAMRCPDFSAFTRWPAYLGSTTPIGRIRVRLVDDLGSICHACHRRPGVFVDHDHFSRLVRGLLCIHCNAHVDTCPHLSGCLWARYLNNPPAAELRLIYPRQGQVNGRRLSVGQQRRVEVLGFNPFAP